MPLASLRPSALRGLLLISLLIASPGSGRATNVLSYHNDAQSTGQNLTETSLTPTSVNSSTFARRFATAVDGQVYAQPLYKAGIQVATGPNAGPHDLVFVATEHDSLYAIDANSGAVVWQSTFLSAGLAGATAITTVPNGDVNSGDITPEIGITGTPVIDPASNFLYLTAKTKQIVSGNTSAPHYVYTLYKVDITNGNATANANIVGSNVFADTIYGNGSYIHRTNASPTALQDPFVVGAGYQGEAVTLGGQSRVYFNALRQMGRPGLVLANGQVYAAFASHGDNGPYHGWLLAFNAANLSLTAALNTTPNGGLGGIWQGGGIPAMDAAGNFYFLTGNGSFNETLNTAGFPANANYSDSFVKVALDPNSTVSQQNPNGYGLKVADYFTPHDESSLNSGDTDLGSGGALVLPDTAGSAAHPHLLLGGGKAGTLYLIDRDNMGKFNAGTDAVVQTMAGAVSGILATPAYFNGMVYVAGGYSNDVGHSFALSNGHFTVASKTPEAFGFAGSTPSISANGANNGIVWMIDNGSHQLRAYSAANLSTKLYSSDQAGARDALVSTSKFSVPTVADGHVFVGTGGSGSRNSLAAFGPPLPPQSPPAAPASLTATAVSGVEIALSWADSSNNEDGFSVERSSDGTNFTQIGTVGVDVTSYRAGGLQVNATYTFRVRAFNSYQGGSNSPYSNTAAATTDPQAPSLDFSQGFANSGGANGPLQYNGSAGINGSRMRLTPALNNEAGSVFTTAVQDIRKFSTQFSFVLTAPTADGFTFCIQGNGPTSLGGAAGGLGYSGIAKSIAIKFDIYNNSGEGPDSTGLFTGGAFPSNAGSVDMTGSGIDLHGGDSFNVTLTYDGTTLTESIVDIRTGATFSHAYTVNIPALLGASSGYLGFTGGTGGASVVQDIIDWTYTTLPSTVPNAPTQLTGQPVSGTEIDLAWQESANSGNAPAGFVVMRSSDGSNYTAIGSTGPTQTSYQDTGLSSGAAFSYEVYATNSVGNSAFSNVVQLATPTPPATPSGLHATSVTDREIDLAWNDNSDNETNFRVLRASAGSDFSVLALLPVNTTAYADKSAKPGITYDYHVQAYNLAGYQDFTGMTQPSLTDVALAAGGSVQEGTSQTSTFTFTRVGETTNPLTVNFQVQGGAGQAASPLRYSLSPAPPAVTIPAGALSTSITVTPASDPGVLGTQSIALNLAPGSGYLTPGTASAAISLLDTPINVWRIAEFGSLSAAQQPSAADGASAAGDGVTNLLKYALGLDPLAPTNPVAVTVQTSVSGASDVLTLTFTRPHPAPPDITYTIEATSDLSSGLWTPVPIASGYPLDNGNGTETVVAQDAQGVGAGARLFIRLRVTH